MNMLKKYLLSNVYRSPDDIGADDPPAKTAVELERERIEVTNNNGTGEKDPPEADADETGDDDAGAEGDGAEKVEAAEGEVDEAKAEEARLKAAKDAETDPEEKKRIQKRIDREVGKRKAAEAERDTLKARLAEIEKDGPKLTEADVEERSDKKAALTVAQREFDAACDRLGTAAAKADKEFDKKVGEMSKEIGPIPTQMIGILDELDNGGEVLSHLTNNVDDAEEIYKLPPAKMALKLAQLSTKVAEAKKPKPREISKVPAPGGTVNTNGRGNQAVLHDKMTDAEWIEQRTKQVAEKRKAGRTNLY